MDDATQALARRIAGAMARLQARGITAGEAAGLVGSEEAVKALAESNADTGAVVKSILEAREADGTGDQGGDDGGGGEARKSVGERFLERSKARRANAPNPLRSEE